MRLARLLHEGTTRAARVVDGRAEILDCDLSDLPGNPRRGEVVAVCPIEQCKLLAPVVAPERQILCAGWNYFDHFEESRMLREEQKLERPSVPTFFSKPPTCVIGPTDEIAWDPEISGCWDYEAELALVIGRPGRNIPAESAMDHVFAFTLANDVSQRDLQKAHGGQWLKGKGIDRSMPLGPWLVTPDELDIATLRIEGLLNGEVVQSAAVSQMAYSVPELIEALSRGMTLSPGDIILTGTPAGVGQSRTPPVFLRDGDLVETRCSAIGALKNPVRRTDLHSPSQGVSTV